MGFLYYGSYQILTKPIVGLKGEFQSQLQVLKNIGYVTYISLLIYINFKLTLRKIIPEPYDNFFRKNKMRHFS